MALGDVTASVRATGWDLDMVVEGFTTLADYEFGLSTNNASLGTARLVIFVTSNGYGTDTNTTTRNRTVYGTEVVRLPSPDENTLNEDGTGGNLTVRIALSDYIYAGDTITGMTVLANLVTNAGGASEGSNPESGIAVTNNSTLDYPKVAAGWTTPSFQLMDSSSKLRAVAFQAYGQSGQPVRAVKFTVTDGTTTNTEIVTTATYDSTMSDACAVIEYVTTTDLTAGLTQGATLTCNFIAYPWVGDATSLLDTSTGTAAPTHLYGPLSMVCNRTGAYSVVTKYVATAGDDTTGDGSTGNPYATISKAASVIAASTGRGDSGGGIIYLKAGTTYAWTGGSHAQGTVPNAWLTITRDPATTTSAADVVINTASGNKYINGTSSRVRFYDITIQSAIAIFSEDSGAIWFDHMVIDYTGVAFVYQTATTYFTQCTITNINTIGPYSTRLCAPALVRGNTINCNVGIFVTTLIGNIRSSVTWTSAASFSVAGGIGFADNKIIAFNKFFKTNNGNPFNLVNQTVDRLAIVQNIFEAIGTTTGPLTSIFADGGTSGDAKGVVYWHNVVVGQRINQSYCSTGANSPLRTAWSVKNNILDDFAMKTDTFTGDGGANGVRVGNWSQVYGAGHIGNVVQAVTNITANASEQEYFGIKTLRAASVAASYIQYTNRLAWTGTGGATAGVGTYTLDPASPAKDLGGEWVLPYDIEGNPRYGADDPGAYAGDTPAPASGSSNFWRPHNRRVHS